MNNIQDSSYSLINNYYESLVRTLKSISSVSDQHRSGSPVREKKPRNYLQKPGHYAVCDDHAFLAVATHNGVFNEVERLVTFNMILRVQIVDVVTRRFSVHDEYRMRYHIIVIQ